MLGFGAVGLRAHLLSWWEKASSKHHVNRMMFLWLPVSNGWRYGYCTVLLYRYIQGDSLYIPERFGRDRKLYEEVMRTWCFKMKDINGRHRHGQQVWDRIKIFLTCHRQCLRSILTDCEVCGVESVGGGHESMMDENISKWPPNSKWPTLYWCEDVLRVRLSTCMSQLVAMGHCMWK